MAEPASAHQSPAGCLGSGLRVSLSKDTESSLAHILRNGDQLVLGAQVSNSSIASPCDLSNLQVTLQVPAPDGTPGEKVLLANGINVRAGTTPYTLPTTVPYTVDLDEGAFQAPITLSYQADVHSGAPDGSTGLSSLSSPFGISRPRTDLQVKPDVVSGEVPLTVTYEYTLTNTSPILPDLMLPTPALVSDSATDDKAVIADDNCAPVTYVSGDNGLSVPAALDPAILVTPPETWKFTCTRTFDSPGLYASAAKVTGHSARDGRPWPESAATAEVTALGSDLVVDKSHRGDFLAGESGEYRILVTNSGTQATSGPITVTDKLPAGLTATEISGTGWDCDLATLTCSQAGPLASGSSAAEVTVKVKVAASPPPSVTNTAIVSGGGEPPGATGNNSDDDPTAIRIPGQPKPSSRAKMKIKSVRAGRRGTAVVKLKVSIAGRISIDDAGTRDLVKGASKKAKSAGTFVVKIRATKTLRRQLAKRSPRKVKLRIRFAATSGTVAVQKRSVRFRLR